MKRNDSKNRGLGSGGRGGVGFLLAQIGAHAASKFAEKIKPLGITPAHAGMMRLLAQSAGQSQKDLCVRLSILPSRLVVLVDELEAKGIIERKDDPNDRRTHALHLTKKGTEVMSSLSEIARAHGDAMTQGLTPEERTKLTELLGKVAEVQGLTSGVHPGYKPIG